MYRQILVDPNQRDLQRIMWKTSADAPIKTYKLATVTYRTVSAPFLATRTLKALADEEKAEFPDAADRGGFELHKWVSNSPELLKDLSASSYVFDKEFQDAPVKTLGMLWDPKMDCLTYKVKGGGDLSTFKGLSLSSKNNPADLISRGCNVDELLKNEMWFSGPDLQTDEYEDNQLFPDPSYRDELKCAVTLSMTEFINNIKAKESCNKEKYLTADEVKRSTEFLAKIAQLSEFKAEIDALKKGKGVSKTSKLKALDPFLDENSLLRVGGRLSNADLPFEAKHQIIIPKAVTDLTTEAFIAALKRLCARRGRISTLMPDNATNFKGAAAELNRFIKLICNKNETLANYFASEAIQWKFIPPRSPNSGGLWEAGVKSFKHHLNRTLVNSKITFEEFETIIIQIEGILNSRPLVPLSDNINEYEVLTPGHFIIGRPISAIPEPAILDISDNRLSRWQYTTKCVQTLWKRWKNDYLNHLQPRKKWQFEKNNVAVGCLVLLKENDLPPCKWAMARILEVIYGTHGKVRVVKLKTATGVLSRSISKYVSYQ
ncbi:integrase catalytic domain-containing protein [Trichonephila clavipes]|nr:integrase catalytic domain-containing protein [Trichonephila clavipes]